VNRVGLIAAASSAALLASGAHIASAQPVAQSRVDGVPVRPPARIGTDDDSVRPLDQGVRPKPPARVVAPKLPKGRVGTDDDSVRPVRPKGVPPR
jgi:hypothetical protein